jgi:hypothetical protein
MRTPRAYFGHLTHGQCSRIRSAVLEAELSNTHARAGFDEMAHQAQLYGVPSAVIARVIKARPNFFDAYLEEAGW